jgi:riboflavin transporter
MNRRSIQILVYCSLFIALSIVLTRFASFRFVVAGVENVRVGLGPFPILLAGIMFGPLFGALVGILADLAGFFISPMGSYMPHFTLVSALYGFIPGLMMYIPLPHSFDFSRSFRIRMIAGVIASQFVTQWILLPWFLFLTFQIPWQVSLIPRYITAPIQVLLYIVIAFALFSQPLFRVWVVKDKAKQAGKSS